MVERTNAADSINGKPAMFFHYSDRSSFCNRKVPMYRKNECKLVQKEYFNKCRSRSVLTLHSIQYRSTQSQFYSANHLITLVKIKVNMIGQDC